MKILSPDKVVYCPSRRECRLYSFAAHARNCGAAAEKQQLKHYLDPVSNLESQSYPILKAIVAGFRGKVAKKK